MPTHLGWELISSKQLGKRIYPHPKREDSSTPSCLVQAIPAPRCGWASIYLWGLANSLACFQGFCKSTSYDANALSSLVGLPPLGRPAGKLNTTLSLFFRPENLLKAVCDGGITNLFLVSTSDKRLEESWKWTEPETISRGGWEAELPEKAENGFEQRSISCVNRVDTFCPASGGSR